MHKIKDWPSGNDFRKKLPRHFTDFVRMLPFQEYTNMVDGPLNLSTRLPKAGPGFSDPLPTHTHTQAHTYTHTRTYLRTVRGVRTARSGPPRT